MNYCSASTTVADPYRAGAELGEKLQNLRPDVVIVFLTIHYADAVQDLVAGLRDFLGNEVLLCGGSGDGIYETSGAEAHGVSALGIHTDGESQWKAAFVRGVGADSAGATIEAARKITAELDAPPTFVFALADGLKADGSRLVEGLRQSFSVPCFGGLTSDDRRFARSVVFLGDETAEDALMLLVASGRVPFRLDAASGWIPIGDIGRATRTEGATLHEIDHRPAEQFLREQAGKTMCGMELVVLPIAEYLNENDSQFLLRSISKITPDGSVTLFGRIHEGARVQVCHATLEEIIGGVETAIHDVKEVGFHPAAAILISCAGRKWLLPQSGQEEVDRTIKELGALPLIGIPSYGEICPFRLTDGTYSPSMFHNVTFGICVLGR